MGKMSFFGRRADEVVGKNYQKKITYFINWPQLWFPYKFSVYKIQTNLQKQTNPNYYGELNWIFHIDCV